MQVRKLTLRKLSAMMREPFETSFGREELKELVLVEVETAAGAVGFGECVAMTGPFYSSETTETAWHILRSYLVPLLRDWEALTPADLRQLPERFKSIRGHQMAKAALEMALWDAFAAETRTPLHRLLGGTRSEIPVGISVGIQADIPALLRKIEGYLAQGFQRVKVKIKPGWDVDVIAAIRSEFGDIPLMADANSAYSLGDIDRLRRLDEHRLMMIEQPLAYDDVIDHVQLQQQLQTPICLDESIHSAADARKAIELGACRIINLKVGRVGGFAESLKLHDVCRDNGIGLWCGGMLETGIGRLHNIALTALPGFNLPGDTAPSARYFEEDLIDPAVSFSRPGFLAVEDLCGVAERVRRDRMERWTRVSEVVKPTEVK